MNWYKTALKQSEFYEFYAYQGLSDETLKDNPIVLFEFIEKLNGIRTYYLDYLLGQVIKELKHSIKPSGVMIKKRAEESKFFDVVEPDYDIEDYCEGHDKGGNPIYNWIQYRDAVNRDTKVKLRDEYEAEIMRIEEKINAREIDDKIMNRIIYFFNNLPWDPVFGGPLWADITEWTGKLYQAGSIEQEPHSDWLIRRIRKLVMVIDTIHSLQHNTNKVLISLPSRESLWLSYALDLVKGVEHPINLAYLSKNRKLVETYRREEVPLYEDKSGIPRSIGEAFPRRDQQLYDRF